jgi:transposase
MQEEHLTLDGDEQKRAMVLTRLLAGEWTNQQAADALGISQRQLRRLKKTYRRDGAAALVHGNRGRRPVNALTDEVRGQVVGLARGKYAGFNHQHLTEKLAEDEGLDLSRGTVRRIISAAGLQPPRPRRAPKHRSRRERLPQEGMLLQADGSRHLWLGPDGPYLTLIGGIDDASGEVSWAVFREQEDAQGYMLWLQAVIQRKGIPLALYLDRHGIFVRNRKERKTLEEQLAGERQPTQFGRVLRELGVTAIYALSPQAKGRIERAWGTLQSRLTSELRLAEALTLADAQRVLESYLPRFNERFMVPAAQPGSAYRPVPADFVAEEVFCFKYGRTVAADNTVRFEEHRLQLLAGRERPSYARAHVEVQERLDGSLAVYYQGRRVAHQPAPAEAPVLRARGGPRAVVAGPATDPAPPLPLHEAPDTTAGPPSPNRTRPAYDHPWKRSLSSKRQPSPTLPAEVAQALADLSEELHEPWASRKPSLTRAASLLATSSVAPATFLTLLHQARDKTLRAQAAGRVLGRQVDGRPKLMAYFFAILENDLQRPPASAPLLELRSAEPSEPSVRQPLTSPSEPAPDAADAPASILKYARARPSDTDL